MYEFRNLDEGRRWAVQSLWQMHAAQPSAETLAAAVDGALQMITAGAPLPPLSLVADVGRIVLGGAGAPVPQRERGGAAAGLEPGLVREYEDYVLGRFYADLSFQRAADAILCYQGRDRARALAFLLTQLCERTGMAGVTLSPAILKRLLEEPAEDVLLEGWQSIRDDGLFPPLTAQYQQLIASVRATGDLVSGEDIFELERGTALAQFGQRLALRQVLHAAAQMSRLLPARKPRTASPARAVATRLIAEDSYPVGGFSSLSNRGSIESLLHSQLIFMERGERPDLFDIKFVRDELLYYSRDENRFLRRHETFLFLFSADLAAARLKDAELPYQRIVMALAVAVTAVRTLIEWLSGDGLRFEFLFLDGEQPLLDDEMELVRMLLADQSANGTVRVERIAKEAVPARCADAARRSLCRCLWISTVAREVVVEGVESGSLALDGPEPRLALQGKAADIDATLSPMEQWLVATEHLLRAWAT
jgi:hypothetical protein